MSEAVVEHWWRNCQLTIAEKRPQCKWILKNMVVNTRCGTWKLSNIALELWNSVETNSAVRDVVLCELCSIRALLKAISCSLYYLPGSIFCQSAAIKRMKYENAVTSYSIRFAAQG